MCALCALDHLRGRSVSLWECCVLSQLAVGSWQMAY